MTEPILQCEMIVKDFTIRKTPLTGKPKEKLRAVDHVTLTLHAGETLGIVGESGSGKSTAGEILGDLQRPEEGTVRYRGTDIRKMEKSAYADYRRNVQFIFQDPKGSMNPNYRVQTILEEPLITFRLEPEAAARGEKVRRICAAVGLEESVLNKYPAELSGGQCQRIAIGRALISGPEVIICDEAVSALDVSVQAQILNLLKDLQKETSVSYLFITHDLGVVHYMADRIAVMHDGKIVEEGTADEVLNTPREEYTRQLLDSCFT